MCARVLDPQTMHTCVRRPEPRKARRLPQGSLRPGGGGPVGPGHASGRAPARPPTHRGSWSPPRPARASCRPSSSPKGSCSRKPSRWVAQGSPRRQPQGAQALGRGGVSQQPVQLRWALPPPRAHAHPPPQGPPSPPRAHTHSPGPILTPEPTLTPQGLRSTPRAHAHPPGPTLTPRASPAGLQVPAQLLVAAPVGAAGFAEGHGGEAGRRGGHRGGQGQLGPPGGPGDAGRGPRLRGGPRGGPAARGAAGGRGQGAGRGSLTLGARRGGPECGGGAGGGSHGLCREERGGWVATQGRPGVPVSAGRGASPWHGPRFWITMSRPWRQAMVLSWHSLP